jgi:surface antigen
VRSLPKLLVCVVVMLNFLFASISGADTGGYPYWDATTVNQLSYDWGYTACKGYCGNYAYLNGDKYYTMSERGYAIRNCTDYVAWKLESLGVSPSITRDRGDGKNWDYNTNGVKNTLQPETGDAAVWHSGGGGHGHVAYVEEVRSHVGGGWDARVSEYNQAGDGTFRSDRWVQADDYVDFNGIGVPLGNWGGVGGAAYRLNYLASGSTLYSNQYLASENDQFVLMFQNDGNLVLYGNGHSLWQSGTSGQKGARLVMQTDGNLVMYRADNSVVWQTRTNNRYGAYLLLQADGNLVVRDSGSAYWWSGTGGHPPLDYFGSDRLQTGQKLLQNQYLRSSDNRYALLLQTDGNLVLYGPGYHVLWSAGASGADRLVMQTDGNLVLYAGSKPVWWTGVSGANNRIVIQPDGNLVENSSNNYPLWYSGTGGQI